MSGVPRRRPIVRLALLLGLAGVALTTLDRPIHRAMVVSWMVETVRHRMTIDR